MKNNNNEYSYFKNIENGNIYRTKEITFNDQSKGTQLQRYSFDFEGWNGQY